jgi:hypothetical protein
MNLHGSTTWVGKEDVYSFAFKGLDEDVRALARFVAKAVDPFRGRAGFQGEGFDCCFACCF